MRYALLGAVLSGLSVVAVPAARGAPASDAPGDPVGEVRGLLRQAYVKINLTRDLTGAGQVLEAAFCYLDVRQLKIKLETLSS